MLNSVLVRLQEQARSKAAEILSKARGALLAALKGVPLEDHYAEVAEIRASWVHEVTVRERKITAFRNQLDAMRIEKERISVEHAALTKSLSAKSRKRGKSGNILIEYKREVDGGTVVASAKGI